MAAAGSMEQFIAAEDPRFWLSAKSSGRNSIPTAYPPGQAVATTAGRLKADWVIHTVGPTYAKSKDKSQLLADCFRNSLAVADELRAATVAFPAISTGVYRWPVDDAARIALETVRATDTRVAEVRFVLFDQRAYDAFTAQAPSEG
jgi:O-acetyl-ADP-ribose deacetylase (regulator of RNase III)